jgi:hypothetical protein
MANRRPLLAAIPASVLNSKAGNTSVSPFGIATAWVATHGSKLQNIVDLTGDSDDDEYTPRNITVSSSSIASTRVAAHNDSNSHSNSLTGSKPTASSSTQRKTRPEEFEDEDEDEEDGVSIPVGDGEDAVSFQLAMLMVADEGEG